MTDNNRTTPTALLNAIRTLGAIALTLIVSACERSSPVDPLALSDAGLGAVTKDTPFDLEIIAGLYRDFLIEPQTVVDESGTYSVIRVVDGDQTLFTIVPDIDEQTIFRIEIAHPLVALDTGTAIGDVFAAAMGPISAGLQERCGWGSGPLEPNVICTPATHRHIHLVFTGPGSRDGAQLPPMSELESWSVLEMHWQP